ncbi:MAG: hypothetical protein IPJ19_14105 [Planctomycetes bacterium]|nr:hypothetical protein [Planctomycetota bacterium]
MLADKMPGKDDDTIGPYNVNGVWTDQCITHQTQDPSVPPAMDQVILASQVRVFTRDFSQPGTTLGSLVQWTAPANSGWNSIRMVPTILSNIHDVYVCSRAWGTQSFSLHLGLPTLTEVSPAYQGPAFEGQDSASSDTNPGVIRFVAEPAGLTDKPPQMMYLDPLPPYGFTPVPGTDYSFCGGPPTCNGKEPSLFAGNILDEAHWVDPAPTNPPPPGNQYEYFVCGRKLRDATGGSSCSPMLDCAWGSVGPCSGSGMPTVVWENLSGGAVTPSGWNLVRLTLPTGNMPPASGPAMDPRFWTLEDPIVPWMGAFGPGGHGPAGELQATGGDYTQSVRDPRLINGLPAAVYLSKAGTSYGVAAFRPGELITQAEAVCQPQGAWKGLGERLPLAYQSVLTHVEFEWNEAIPVTPPADQVWGNGCLPIVNCSNQWFYDTNASQIHTEFGRRKAMQEHSDIYETRDLSGQPMWVLAIASGFVAAWDGASGPPLGQPASCQWSAVAGRPMLALVDVTKTGTANFGPMQLVRIGLGTIPAGRQSGHAWSVRTKTVGRKAFAYVGGMLGRVSVYEVTGSKILPIAHSPYLDPVQGNPDEWFLAPLAELDLPGDPCDNGPANCIDMEIVGDFLYCALGRLEFALLISRIRLSQS